MKNEGEIMTKKIEERRGEAEEGITRVFLLKEIDLFRRRNVLAKDKSRGYCCPDCLKAHLLRKAFESGLNKEFIQNLSNSIKGEAGHKGYYIDEGELHYVYL